MVWEKGKQLRDGQYVIEGVLGSGVFGITYLAIDTKGQQFAIKTLNERVQSSHDFEKSQQAFFQEVKLLQKCRHRHIVGLGDVIQEGGLFCMVMEYIAGATLANYVTSREIVSKEEALLYIRQIGEALIVVHNNNLLHRYINPRNIILRSNLTEAVLIDFGLVREFTPNLTQSHTAILSDGYAPPEQYFIKRKRGAYTDVYALAATLYFMLTGKEPTPALDRSDGEQLVPAKEINRQISDRLNDAIIKGMALEPEDRPQSVREWLDLLKVEDVDIDSQIAIEIKPLEYQIIGQTASLEIKPLVEYQIIGQTASVLQAIIWQVGQKLYGNRYTIIKAQQDRTELGSGGLGITYLARDDRGREVVIKTLNEKAQTSPKFAKIQQNFRDEATRLGYCKHPHIVQIENKFDVGQLPCIVMEYIKGETLWERVDNHGALSEAEALLYIQQIGEALLAVHGKGLLHRDVNPSNIIVRANQSEAVLIDFGISKEYIPDLTQQYTVEYTPCFAPLEQHDQNDKLGNYTDVYALAATMFYLVTGNRPTPAANRVINDEFIPQSLDNTKISDKVKNAILNGMALDPKKRSQSVDEWLKLLKNPQYSRNLSLIRGVLLRIVTLVVAPVVALVVTSVGAALWDNLISSFVKTPKIDIPSTDNKNLQSKNITFQCLEISGKRAIFLSGEGFFHKLPVIEFDPIKLGDNAIKESCQTVAKRLNSMLANNGGSPGELSLNVRKVDNGDTVVCILKNEQSSCNYKELLFTLNQKNVKNPKEILETIINFDPLSSSTNIVIKNGDFSTFTALQPLFRAC